MRVGIIGAMPQEVESIKKHMQGFSEVAHASRVYYQGQIHGVDVVLVFSRWGKVSAATTATSLIEKFQVSKIIFTGVAGATARDLNVGDVVIGHALYQHDMDASPLFPKHEIPLSGKTFFKAEKDLVVNAEKATQKAFDDFTKMVPEGVRQGFGITAPKYVTAMITSGDQFVQDSQYTENIMSERPETAAIEMEGAAVAQVCDEFNVPFVVIRTISDRADHSAHVDFQQFIDNVATHYACSIIEQMILLESERQEA